jgi:hypothetical protein
LDSVSRRTGIQGRDVSAAELSAAAVKGMRIELRSRLTDGISDVGELLGQVMQQPGYLHSRRWRVGCRLLHRLELAWPPNLKDEAEVMLLLYRTKRFLAGRPMNRVN